MEGGGYRMENGGRRKRGRRMTGTKKRSRSSQRKRKEKRKERERGRERERQRGKEWLSGFSKLKKMRAFPFSFFFVRSNTQRNAAESAKDRRTQGKEFVKKAKRLGTADQLCPE